MTLLLRSDSINWLYYYAPIVLDSTPTQRLYLTLPLRTDCTWLFYYAAIVLDSTTTQRLYLTLLLRSDCTWLYYYAPIVLDSTPTQRLYLTLLLRSDCTWLYYYAAIVLDSTTTQRLYLTLLLRSDGTWLYSYAAIVLDSTITQRWYLTLLLRSDSITLRCCSYIGSFSAKLPLITCWSCGILTEIVVLVCFITSLKCATFFFSRAIFNNYRAKTQATTEPPPKSNEKKHRKVPKRINLLPVVPTPVSSYLAWCPYLCLWWRFGVVLGTDSLKFQQKTYCWWKKPCTS